MKYCYLILYLFIIASCKESKKQLPYYDTADFTPKWEMSNEKTFHQIRPFKLINQENQLFTERDIEGKICVADFFFTTCPGICLKMTNSMYDIQKEFFNDDEILLLSHSVTPEKDSVPVLKQYAIKHHVNDQKWNLVTGDKKAIYAMARKSYLAVKLGKPEELYDMVHTENFVLVDQKRRVRGFYDGTNKEDVQRLIEDIAFLSEQ